MTIDKSEYETIRLTEIAKYEEAYKHEAYKMGDIRKRILTRWFEEFKELPSNYLDVACGRGESLEIADSFGVKEVAGTEVVPALLNRRVIMSPITRLPFMEDSFEAVTCLDVLEHIPDFDVEYAIKRLSLVARDRVLVSVSNINDGFGPMLGLGKLHVTQWPYNVWYYAMRDWVGDKFNVRYRADLANDFGDDISMYYEWERIPEVEDDF